MKGGKRKTAGRPKRDAVTRFIEKIEKEKKCLVWTDNLNRGGYGLFWDGEKTVHAHRFSYKLFFGEILENMSVCHKCDNRKCVSPSHLWLGSAKDNYEDMRRKGRAGNLIGKNQWHK